MLGGRSDFLYLAQLEKEINDMNKEGEDLKDQILQNSRVIRQINRLFFRTLRHPLRWLKFLPFWDKWSWWGVWAENDLDCQLWCKEHLRVKKYCKRSKLLFKECAAIREQMEYEAKIYAELEAKFRARKVSRKAWSTAQGSDRIKNQKKVNHDSEWKAEQRKSRIKLVRALRQPLVFF